MKLFYRQLLILTCFISLPVSVLYAQQGTNQYIPVSQHQTIESGTYWPAGQMLPHFATPASQLDGIDMKQGKLSSEEKTMLLAVQGIINKRQPRIFLYEHFSEGKHKWPRLLNLSVNELEATQYMRLVSKYKNELKGVILYDPEKSVHYLNLASTVAGLEDAIPVTSQLYELLKQQNIQLPVLADLRKLPYTKATEIYEYMYDQYWKKCTHRLLISLPPQRGFVRDLAVASGAAIVWLDARDWKENTVLRKFMKTMQPGESIAQALLRKDYKVPMACGGNGTCGKCKVEIDGAWVNSCKLYPKPEEDIIISAFGWGEGREELTRIAGVEKTNITEGRALEAKRQTRKTFLAVDIGTTTIAAALAEKETGAVLATSGCGNSQRIFGQDVLSRIKASVAGTGEKLKALIRQDILNLLEEIQKKQKDIVIEHIYIAGNTTMEHLYMGDSCEGLGKAPFTPVSLAERKDSLSNIPVTLLPGISAFVGADIAAGMLACGMDEEERPSLLLDLGTNGEMVLALEDKMIATSAPAGPALEGGNISCGVASVTGAISKVRVIGERTIIGTIGNAPATGICGTGVLELVAGLYENHIIDASGQMKEKYREEGFPLARMKDGKQITFTQQDIREVQLAKAAIHSGIELLLEHAGISMGEIKKVYLAGGFGVYLDVHIAAGIGLLPAELEKCTKAVGNTSLQGCIAYGSSEENRSRTEEMIKKCESINLAEQADFEERYVANMNFPE